MKTLVKSLIVMALAANHLPAGGGFGISYRGHVDGDRR